MSVPCRNLSQKIRRIPRNVRRHRCHQRKNRTQNAQASPSFAQVSKSSWSGLRARLVWIQRVNGGPCTTNGPSVLIDGINSPADLCGRSQQRSGVHVNDDASLDLTAENISPKFRQIAQGRGLNHAFKFLHRQILCDPRPGPLAVLERLHDAVDTE